MEKLLFICNSNLTRSPACEDIVKDSKIYSTKSAGIFPEAVVHVNQEMIDWADKIFVMCERTDKHLTYLKENYTIGNKFVTDLDLPDYIYSDRNDPELIKVLKQKLSSYLTV